MQRFFFYYTGRPINYREQADQHAQRVSQAGGQGVDVDFVEGYYRLIGQNLLTPRAYLNLKCGHVLDAQGLVAYIFCPHGADMQQPDPALRASVGQDAHGNPTLLFTGSQYYDAVDATRFDVGTQDCITHAYVSVEPRTEGWVYSKGTGQQDGAYSLRLVDTGGYAEGALTNHAVQQLLYARTAGYFTGSASYRPSGMFFLRQANRARIALAEARYSDAFNNQPAPQPGDELRNSEPFRVGEGLRGGVRELLNLPAVASVAVSDNIWNWLDAH